MSNAAFSLFVLGPVIAGAIIAALNSDTSNGATERVEAWVRQRQQGTSGSAGWFKRYVFNPLLWTIVKFCDWTDGFTHRGLKNGTRVAAALYIVALWLFALYVAVVVVIAVVIMAIALYVALKIIGSMGDSDRSEVRRSSALDVARRMRGSVSYEKTGVFSEEETGRTDESGRIFRKTGVFSEDEAGRIDEEGRTFEKTGIFSEEEVGRTDADGRVFVKTGIFTEEEVGRVDEDGKVFRKSGVFSEEETGRYEKT
jgi:uncharacterized membrane protein